MVDPAVRALAHAIADRSGCRPCDAREQVEVWLQQEADTQPPPAWLEGYLQTKIPRT